jgi:hypothetical protein
MPSNTKHLADTDNLSDLAKTASIHAVDTVVGERRRWTNLDDLLDRAPSMLQNVKLPERNRPLKHLEAAMHGAIICTQTTTTTLPS